jgi:hypothetical protein
LSVAINLTFAETLPVRDGFVIYEPTTAVGGAALNLIIGDQPPGMQDFAPVTHAVVTQVVMEMVILPTDANARVTQIVVEFISQNVRGAGGGGSVTGMDWKMTIQ